LELSIDACHASALTYYATRSEVSGRRVAEYLTSPAAFNRYALLSSQKPQRSQPSIAPADNLVTLERAYRRMRAAKDLDDWTRADLLFHESILDATGNPSCGAWRVNCGSAGNALFTQRKVAPIHSMPCRAQARA